MNWDDYKNFSQAEFDNGGPEMKKRFMDRLQQARTACTALCVMYDIPEISFNITSGSRSKENNQRVGGKDDSCHLIGCASDIEAVNSRSRMLIVKSLLLAGFSRLGISKQGLFIHVDDGDLEPESSNFKKDPHVMWLY